MKIFYLVSLFVLTGCSVTVPVKAKFPEAPVVLTEPCVQLKKIENAKKI